ncbi:MAG: hypothetical protein KJ571_13970 [Bacteroidetes bacterium]|nr:hypothetical protein [Bacteroidota bacterium]
MLKSKIPYYGIPALLSVIMFGSNFLSTDLFGSSVQNFAVWFILSLFAFVCGWIMNKTLGWVYGGKILFAVTIATVFVSILLVSFFSDYFAINDLLTENLILYSLRNILLGAMGLFGMMTAEMFLLQKSIDHELYKNGENSRIIEEAKKEADIIIREAKVNSEKILLNTEKRLFVLKERKNKIENQLREFIRVEKELIANYENEKEE